MKNANPTTPADAFEAALEAKAQEIAVPILRDMVSRGHMHAGVLEGARWAREWERKAALESEPVRGLVEALRKYQREDAEAGQEPGTGHADVALDAFERAKGGGK